MKKNIFVYGFIIILILFSIGLGVVFAFNNNSSEDESLKDKTKQEIELLEYKIVAIMNELNHINFLNTIFTKEKIVNNNQDSMANTDISQTSSETEKSSSDKSSQNKSLDSLNNSNNSESEDVSNSNDNTKYEIKSGGILINGKNNIIDWDYAKLNVETIYTIWPTIVADLNSLNIKNEDVLNFSNTLDKVTINIKNEDKVTTLSNFAILYTFLSNYKRQILQDKQAINIDNCISSILNSYALVEQDNWQEVKNQLTKSINYYSNVMDEVNENLQNQNRINKAFILLNELNNSIDLKDKEIYYIKYRNVMEELVDL